MSDLEKAIELKGRRHRGEMYGCVDCYQNRPCTDRLILDAARRFANLTSPVTWDDEAREDIRFAVQGTKVDTSEAAVIDETIDAMLLFLSGGLTYE